MFEACANEQTLKCLTVLDEYTREALAIDVAGLSMPGIDGWALTRRPNADPQTSDTPILVLTARHDV